MYEIDMTEALSDAEGDDIEFQTLEEGKEQDISDSEFKEDDEELSEKVEKERAEAEVIEEEEPREEEKEVSKKPEKKPDERELNEEVKKILAHLGKDETLKSKDLEIKVSDLTPEEAKGFLQKGARFYQHMEELSVKERTILERELALARELEQVQDLRSKVEADARRRAAELGATLPRELEIDQENDTPEVVGAKKIAQIQWKNNQQLSERLAQIESGFDRGKSEEQETRVLAEINSSKGDFPLASPEETIAVHVLSKGKIPIREIMQRGQQIYGSTGFVDKVFAACPDIRKHYADKFEKEYLVRNKAAAKKRVPMSPASSSRVVPAKFKKSDVTFDNVSTIAKRAIAESERLEEGEEL